MLDSEQIAQDDLDGSTNQFYMTPKRDVKLDTLQSCLKYQIEKNNEIDENEES